ncbi:PAAR domain-containing protein [Humibacillus xanthopallidus]|nr:PAAR domain-containing protein [Humibacillus xanthopallidus]
MVLTPGGPVPLPLPHPFSGAIQSGTATTVKIGGQPVATHGSVAVNSPSHVPTPPGTSFQTPPSNQGKVVMQSVTVKAGGKGIARVGDQVSTCNDPADAPVSTIVGPAGTVMIG